MSRIDDEADLTRAYDESGEMVMHLQKGSRRLRRLRALPGNRSADHQPSVRPRSADVQRTLPDRPRLPERRERAAKRAIITKVINAVFRWDFNSCEAILKDGILWPIDFANATPDIALTSLHYYFPWAIKALLAWSLYCLVTERRVRITMDLERWFKIADSDRSYWEKLDAYEALADKHFETARFEEFKARKLTGLDEAMHELVASREFDAILETTVRTTFPEHEQERFLAHYRGIMSHWLAAESPR